MSKKETIKQLKRVCNSCGQEIEIVLHGDGTYRNGHYFGKVPLCTNKEIKKSIKYGCHKKKLGNTEVRVLKKDPKIYGYAEYWECPKCYKK